MDYTKVFSVLLALMSISAVSAQETNVSLYAAPFLGLFVTSMVVIIVWVTYKGKFE